MLLFCGVALAGDVTGIWTGTLIDGNGDPLDVSFRFAQKGATLTGKMYGDNESTPIKDVKVVGDQITFSVTTELNGQISTFEYTGTQNGDRMDVSRVRVNTGAKPANPQTLKLKRLT